jgi:regulator of RNase E activity RraA
VAGAPIAGLGGPCRHSGSVDVFLEALEQARPGDVMVIDNEGRDDEGCIGDLVTLEAERAGLAGIVVWGRVRDVAELRRIGLPSGAAARRPSARSVGAPGRRID